MAEQIKLRAQIQGEIAELRILLQHPMESGLRKDDQGNAPPMNFIQTFTVRHNGKPLIDGQLNGSISRNPLFAFRVRGIKAGDKLVVSWQDNLGEQRRDEFTVG